MKKILFAILFVLAASFGGLYFYVSNMDWNEHKEKIAEQVMEITGKKLVFDGELSFSILPYPYLRAKDVKVYNDGENSPLAVAPSLVAELELVPLLKGGLDVNKMSLVKPTIYIKITKNGRINWQGEPKVDDFNAKPAHMALNGVMLKKATVEFSDENNNINMTFPDVTAEVTAESVNGPYRFEGNLTKNGDPLGFAFSLGEYSEGTLRGLNVAITHPASEGYLRFDGQIMLENNAYTGNILTEAQKPLEFARKFLNYEDVDEKYNQPITISTELKSNKARVDFANFIIKYGQNIGAGNILIPLKQTKSSKEKRPRAEVVFEMTDFDLNMVVNYLSNKLNAYKEEKEKFEPKLPYDLAFDLKSVKTYYNGAEMKDFALSLDVKDNKLTIKNLIATGPGNTQIASRGKAFADNGMPNYAFDFGFVTEDSQKMLNWLGIKPNVVAPGTFKSAQAGFSVSGTPKNIKISPVNLVFDRMTFNGSVGIIFDIRNSLYISLNTDNPINFDNYFAALPEDVKNKNLAAQLEYRFEQIRKMNDWDLFINTQFPGGIVDKNSFGVVDFSAEVINSNMEIKTLNIAKFEESNIDISGNIGGFGSTPTFEKLNYKISTKDFPTLWKKIKFTNEASLLFKEANMSSRGIVNGTPDNLSVKSVTTIGDTDFVYDGLIKKHNDEFLLDGNVEIKAPNFTKFVSQTFPKHQYAFLPSSLMMFNAKINKDTDKLVLQNIDAFLGSNTVKGQLEFSAGKTSGDITISDLNLDTLFYGPKTAEGKSFVVSKQSNPVEFLQKPEYFDKAVIDYSLFGKAEFDGKIGIRRLTYKNFVANNVKANVSASSSAIKLEKLSADVNEGTVSGKIELSIGAKKEVNGLLFFKKQPLANFNLFGLKYGILNGTADMKYEFSSLADSEDLFMTNLKARLGLNIENMDFKGINLPAVYEDLAEREKSDGIAEFVNNNLQQGLTSFEKVEGDLVINDGALVFEKTAMRSPNYVAVVSGGINLKEWQIDAKAEVTFPTLKEMPAMYFAMNGSLENPAVTGDAQAIADKYDNYWQQLAEEKKRRQIEAQNKLREEIKLENDKIRQIVKDMEHIVLPNLRDMEKVVEDEKGKSQYRKKYAEAQRVYDEAKNYLAVEQHETVTKADLNMIKGRPEILRQKIDEIRKDMDNLYEDDMRRQYNNFYDKIIELYKRAKIAAGSYRQQMGRYDFEGAKFFPPVIFNDNKEFKQRGDEIEKDYVSIDKNYSTIMNEYYENPTNMALYQVEEYNQKVSKLLKESEELLKNMRTKIAENLQYVQTELKYANDPELREKERQAAEEAKRKAEEEERAKAEVEAKAKAEAEAAGAKALEEALAKAAEETEKQQLKQQEEAAANAEEQPAEQEEKQPEQKEIEQPVKKPFELEMHKIDGDSQYSGSAKGTILKEGEEPKKEQPEPENKNKQSFLRRVIGEIAQTTGKILKIE